MDDLVKIKSDALKLLSFRPRSIKELEERLKTKRYGSELIGKAVAQLKQQGLLDDEKFGRLAAHSALYSRPMSRKRLEIDLEKKGLSKDVVQNSIKSLGDYDEAKVARELVFGRFQRMTGLSDEKKKARLFGFLRRRGFATGVIFSVLSELFSSGGGNGAGFDDD